MVSPLHKNADTDDASHCQLWHRHRHTLTQLENVMSSLLPKFKVGQSLDLNGFVSTLLRACLTVSSTKDCTSSALLDLPSLLCCICLPTIPEDTALQDVPVLLSCICLSTISGDTTLRDGPLLLSCICFSTMSGDTNLACVWLSANSGDTGLDCVCLSTILGDTDQLKMQGV